LLEQDPRVDVVTVYCSLLDPRLWRDAEHLTKDAFDIPMLDGHSWTHARNYSPWPSLDKFYGLVNPGIIALVRRHDCCVVFGHHYMSFWLAIAAARVFGKPLLLTTDATSLDPRPGARWRAALRTGLLLPCLYRRVADLVLVPSTASRRFVRSLGVPADRVVLTPYVVDNDSIAAAAAGADRTRIRKRWRIPADAAVLMFCAKFLPRKRPHDALEAFAQANVPNSHLLMVGDGPLGDSLKTGAGRLGVGDRVHFPGLVKYSALPEHYVASDALVLASEHEPYGLPVNEAMVCGVPAIVSDRVGAGYDLVEHGKTGLVYPCGDVEALARVLSQALRDPDTLRRMGEAARRRMESWSPRENAEAIVQAVETAIAGRHPRAGA